MPTRDEQTAFPKLTGEQISRLEPYGTPEDTEAGQVLFAEGDRGFDFFLLIEGTVEIVEHSGGEESAVTVHEAGEFAGDVRAGSVKRVASAVGEGSIAVKFVHQHLGA